MAKAKLTLHNRRGHVEEFTFENGDECVDDMHVAVVAWVDDNPLEADGMTVTGWGDYEGEYTLVREDGGWNIEVDGKTALPATSLEIAVGEWLEVVADYGDWEDS